MKELFTTEEKGIQRKEFIQVPFELKEVGDADDDKIASFTGYASTFNNVDLGRDRILAGAFLQTMKKDGTTWPILHMHNSHAQIGWNAAAEEDKRGLKVSGELNLEVQLAREQHALAKQAKKHGAKMGLSIGYRPEVWEIDGDKRIRDLKQVKMYEYSFVVWPMNPKGRVTQIKSIFEDICEEEDIDLKDVCGSARMMEKLLREVGYSKSQATGLANMAVRVHKGENLREVGRLISDPGLIKAADSMQKLIDSIRA